MTIDWEPARNHFIETAGTLTLKEISETYGINYDTLRERAAKERWTYQRAEYQITRQKAEKEKRLVKLAGEAVKFDDNSLQAAKIGQTLIAGRLAQIAQLFQAGGQTFEAALSKMRSGKPVELHELRSTINYKELLSLGQALTLFQDAGRKALGTDVDRLEITGADGGAVEVVSINAELNKPDLDRMGKILEVMQRAGIAKLDTEQIAITVGGEDGDDEVVDAEIVEDEEELTEET